MCCLLSGSIYSQDPPLFPETELNIQIENVPNSTITFELIPLGANWANTQTGCNYNLYNDETTRISSITAGSNGYVTCWQNGYNYRYYSEGNERIVDALSCAQSTAGILPIRNGFYRLNVKENGQLKIYVYFDWRDTGFPIFSCRSCFGSNDMTIRYNGLIEELVFWNKNRVTIDTGNPDMLLQTDGVIITWADIKCYSRDFSPFWSKGLVLISEDNHPKIVWGPNTPFATTHFKIYRATSTIPPDYKNLTFYLIGTTNDTTYEYIDYEIEYGEVHQNSALYYVKAYNSSLDTYSSATNTVLTTFEIMYKIANETMKDEIPFTNNLRQNYPNPFNPTTTINFATKKDGFVTLKIYDLLGRKVETLISAHKPAGNYSVEFSAIGGSASGGNASELPSGIYVYRLTSGNFTTSKKLMLMK